MRKENGSELCQIYKVTNVTKFCLGEKLLVSREWK